MPSGFRRSPRSSTRRYHSNIFRLPRFEQFEERRVLAVNLALTSASLVDLAGNAVTSPAHGEQVYVKAGWNSEDLPSGSQYQLEFRLDGVPLRPNPVSFGAG